MGERSVFTEATQQAAEIMLKARQEFAELLPAKYMRERMNPTQFKAEFGVGIQEFNRLSAIIGPDNMKEVVARFREKIKEAPNA